MRFLKRRERYFFRYLQFLNIDYNIINNMNDVAIIDFEFATFRRTSTVLISGAMILYTENSVTKLEGNPIVINENGSLSPITRNGIKSLILSIKNIFKNKPDKLTPILKQLDLSIKSTINNLKAETITSYINKTNKIPIILTWNGHTDRKILIALRINCTILNLTCYDEYNDGLFYLKLTNFNNNNPIYSKCIGNVNKNGRLLNLSETHAQICTSVHQLTYAHDPMTDVVLTKCIYTYLIGDG